MQESTWASIMATRSRAGNSLTLPYVILHSVVLVIIAFESAALDASSVQLALAASTVIGTLWLVINLDSVFADFDALTKDMSESVAASNLGRNWAKMPIGAMRVMGIVFSAVLVIVELLAIY
jgi:hypothetical protein|tara:strand:+ start:89 stop:454 length:366 start_codon:yes stop_codon:yes gene_type:complete